MTASEQRAREAARSGYGISENALVRDLFYVHKPDGMTYAVDASYPKAVCTCPTPVHMTCKHVALVRICQRYVAMIERNEAAKSQGTTARRHFSRGHINQFRSAATAAR